MKKNWDNIDKAIQICQIRLRKEMLIGTRSIDILSVLFDNDDFCERLVKLDEQNLYDYTFDLKHDIAGLSRNDEHFLPRI